MAKIAKDIEDNTENINKNCNDINVLKAVALEQQKSLESYKRKEIVNNIMMTGIPNNVLKINDLELTDDKEKIRGIFNYINCPEISDYKYDITSLPSYQNKNTHSVKLKFGENNDVKKIIEQAKLLKNLGDTKIYIKYDEPYHSRKENNRLRKKRYDLSKDERYHNDVIKIEKGKLYYNGMVVKLF